MSSLPLQFLLLTVSGWMTRDHQRVTDYQPPNRSNAPDA
jgi:hypothetical protein